MKELPMKISRCCCYSTTKWANVEQTAKVKLFHVLLLKCVLAHSCRKVVCDYLQMRNIHAPWDSVLFYSDIPNRIESARAQGMS